MNFLFVFSALVSASWALTCTVTPSLNSSIDDAPAIVAAFKACGQGGTVAFQNHTYFVHSVMNTTGLKNVNIDLKGTLLWNTNFTYWLANSLPVGYQNQSSAWLLGGDNINFQGHGYGTFNGSGDAWYTYTKGVSNYPRRPHQITIGNTTNSIFQGIRFLQSPMWTMTVIHSKNIVLEDIYVNNLSNSGSGSSNTDGINTIYSNNITLNKWEVLNGDDSIAIKANSTNISVTNSIFRTGLGLAFGSIGQYLNAYETIENVFAENISCYSTLHATYVKTWTGQQVGYPPNGGGGGLGHIKNVTVSNFTVSALRGTPFAISQCTTFSGTAGNCNSSLFQIEDFTFKDVAGTIAAKPIASLQCSAAAPCTGIAIENLNLNLTSGAVASGYNCNDVDSPIGFVCTGLTCGTPSATGSC